MKRVLKLLFLIYMVTDMIIRDRPSYVDIVLLLLLVAVNIFMERYNDSVYVVVAAFVFTVAGILSNQAFIILLCPLAFDFIYKKIYAGIIPVLACEGYFLLSGTELPVIVLITLLCGFVGFILRQAEDRESNYKNSLDEERRLRYELEQAKARLLNSSREIAGITEIRERNRIAREIHDSVGHGIAGILIQLQVVRKLFDKQADKSREILDLAINSLSDSLTLLRDTVHNIKPAEVLGVEYIKQIISNFSFCPVNFSYSGDFNSILPNHMEILIACIKEAMTNTARHSKATRMEIAVDINERYIRLYIKDNGIGSTRIKEGLGLSGMRERIANVGGSFNASSQEGFVIVCLIPVAVNDGSELFENSHSR